MTAGWLALSLLAAPLLGACGGEDAVGDERFGQDEAGIINGQLDTEHDAVVAIFGNSSACTATVIHVEGGFGYLLTAAHCLGNGPIQTAVMADDYQSSGAKFYPVVAQLSHPQYNAQNVANDFAMLRVGGVAPTTPFIPALTKAEDALKKGTAVEHVGYGLVSYPSGQTSKRHRIMGSIAQVAYTQFLYNQPNGGPCSGDSGGPNLVTVNGMEYVAGVISYGDQQCVQSGVSGRVSSVYESFVLPFITKYTGTDPGSSSSASTSASSTGSGATTGAGAGGSNPGTGSGAGAGEPGLDDGNRIAGDYSDRRYEGELLSSSSCTVATAGGRSRGLGHGGLLLAAAIGALGHRRRRTRA